MGAVWTLEAQCRTAEAGKLSWLHPLGLLLFLPYPLAVWTSGKPHKQPDCRKNTFLLIIRNKSFM